MADGRVSEEERRVIWCVANQNNLLVTLQMLCFVGLFGFVVYYFDKVGSTDWSPLNLFIALLECLLGQFHWHQESILLQEERLHRVLRSVRYHDHLWHHRPRHLPLATNCGHSEKQKHLSYIYIYPQSASQWMFLVPLKWLHYRSSIMVVMIDNTSIAILHAEAPGYRNNQHG